MLTMTKTHHDIAVITTGPDFNIDLVNAGYKLFALKFGLLKEESDIFGKKFPVIFPQADREEAEKILQTLVGRDETWSSGDMRNASLDFETAAGKFNAQVFTLVGSAGEEKGFLFIFSSASEAVTEKKDVETSITSIMDGMGDAVIIVDEKCGVSYMNRITREIFGSPPSGASFHTAFEGNDNLCPRCNIESFGEGDVAREVESSNGRFFLATFSPVMEKSGRKSVIGVLKDITFRKRMEEELRHLTITDNLTGLYNKRHFNARLKEETGRAKRQRRQVSILFADIDGFKKYNDTYGHSEGDVMLARLGEVFHGIIRRSVDSAFRYGGDEFTAILPEAADKDAAKVAERVKQTFNKIVFTPSKDGRTFNVTASISVGVAQYDGAMTQEELLNRADRAMYAAKHMGGNCVMVAD